MKQARLNLIIDLLAFAGFVFLTASGVLMRYILPPGSGHHTTLWGLDRHEWGDIHFWISVAFLVALALHLLLHWRWILSVCTGSQKEGSGIRIALAIVALLALLALAFAPLTQAPEKSPHWGGGKRWGLSQDSIE